MDSALPVQAYRRQATMRRGLAGHRLNSPLPSSHRKRTPRRSGSGSEVVLNLPAAEFALDLTDNRVAFCHSAIELVPILIISSYTGTARWPILKATFAGGQSIHQRICKPWQAYVSHEKMLQSLDAYDAASPCYGNC